MTFLITNDDGIDELGLETLRNALSQVTSEKIVTVAPKHHQSGVGHKVNIRTDIAVQWRTPNEVSVDSTPADCVRLGLNYLYDDIHCVVSGINQGCNLGSDMYPSGTIAAAREATIHGLYGIAFSQFKKAALAFDWQRTQQWTIKVLGELLSRTPEPGVLWSVNFPHLTVDDPEPEIIYCTPCRRPLLTEFRQQEGHYRYIGDDINRRSDVGTDVSTCLSGQIAITPIRLW